MTNPKKIFYIWLKEQTTISPPRSLDDKILAMAGEKLAKNSSTSFLTYNWKLTGLTVTASIVLALIFTLKFHEMNELKKVAINESPEMIMNYKNIELMMASADLTDEDWNKIERIR